MARWLGILAIAFLWGTTGPVAADSKHDRAIKTTETLLYRAHQALGHANGGPALRTAISDAFAFHVWERFLLDGRAKALTKAERREFRGLLPGFLAHLYRQQFDRGLTSVPRVGGVRKVRRDVLVESRFQRANGGDLPVQWRLRDFPDRGSRVIDVMVAGTSFLLLKRDEFNALIDSGGAAALLAHMRSNSY